MWSSSIVGFRRCVSLNVSFYQNFQCLFVRDESDYRSRFRMCPNLCLLIRPLRQDQISLGYAESEFLYIPDREADYMFASQDILLLVKSETAFQFEMYSSTSVPPISSTNARNSTTATYTPVISTTSLSSIFLCPSAYAQH